MDVSGRKILKRSKRCLENENNNFCASIADLLKGRIAEELTFQTNVKHLQNISQLTNDLLDHQQIQFGTHTVDDSSVSKAKQVEAEKFVNVDFQQKLNTQWILSEKRMKLLGGFLENIQNGLGMTPVPTIKLTEVISPSQKLESPSDDLDENGQHRKRSGSTASRSSCKSTASNRH